MSRGKGECKEMVPEVGVPSIDALALLHAAQDKFPFRRRAGSPTWCETGSEPHRSWSALFILNIVLNGFYKREKPVVGYPKHRINLTKFLDFCNDRERVEAGYAPHSTLHDDSPESPDQ